MDTIEKALNKHQSSQDDFAKEREAHAIESENDQVLLAANTGVQTEALSENKAPKEKVISANINDVSGQESPQRDSQNQLLELDLPKLAKLGVIIQDDKRSKIKEEYKHIKRPLLQKAAIESGERNKNLIMVTSAYSGEGKTFSSLNLAMSIAVERDRRVLLVDADVVKPGLDILLEMEERPGLVEYLSGDVSSFSDILLNTNVPNLTIVPAGKTHHLSHELLASNAMVDLTQEISSRYADRIIIFDCPPMLITSEAKVLSRLVDQIVIVVEQDKTSQSAVLDAIGGLEREKLSGLILNKSTSSRESYYGYYYSDEK